MGASTRISYKDGSLGIQSFFSFLRNFANSNASSIIYHLIVYSVFFSFSIVNILYMIGGGESFLGKNTFKLTLNKGD